MITPNQLLELDKSDRSRAIACVQQAYCALSYDPITNPVLEVFLNQLMPSSSMHPFHIGVVGSSLYNPNNRRDIDLLLTPRSKSAGATLQQIEMALLTCIWLGRSYGNIKVDPVYRSDDIDSQLHNHCLEPYVLIKGIRLENPAITFRLAAGIAQDTRPIGLFSVFQEGPAVTSPFYKKLPRHSKSQPPYLTPALSIEHFIHQLQVHRQSDL